MWNGLDKRRFPRVKLPCLVRVFRAKKPVLDFKTYTENIGEGGICTILGREVSIFCGVHLEIDLKDAGPLVGCEGLVVWTVRREKPARESPPEYDTGIEFFNLKDDDRLRIRDLIGKVQEEGRGQVGQG